jgi:large subunit ribosomal protein L35
MPKIKTSKTAAKRFKLTGTGKLTHTHTRLNHLMINKSGSRTRRLQQETVMEGGHLKRIKRLLPNGL